MMKECDHRGMDIKRKKKDKEDSRPQGLNLL